MILTQEIDYMYNEPVQLSMHLTGKGTNIPFDLRAFSTAIFHFTNIIDNTHCVLLKQERLSKDKRNEVQIRATDISRGSIHIDFDIIMNGIQLIAPVLGWVNPYSIWEYTVNAYNFLKTVGIKNLLGEKPQMQITDSPESININGSNNTIVITPDIAKIASRSRFSYRAMSEVITDEGIENMHVSSRTTENLFSSFDLSSGESSLFTNPSVIDETTVDFDANILGFDKERLTGRLEVLSGVAIPHGKYPFKVIGDQCDSLYVTALSQNKVKITALTEKVLDNISGFKIKKIHIISLHLYI